MSTPIKIYSPLLVELATISAASSAIRTEKINSDNILNFSIRVKDAASAYINKINVIGLGSDFFDIAWYKKEQPIDGLRMISVECEHVSYRLNNNEYNKTYYSMSDTPAHILTDLLTGTDFTVGAVAFTDPIVFDSELFGATEGQEMSRRSLLMQLVNQLGGELEFDGFSISILTARGSGTPIELTVGKDVTVIAEAVDKRNCDEAGEPTISYTLAVHKGATLALGDTVTIEYSSLGISTTLRIVSKSYDPYNPNDVTIEVGHYTYSLEDTLYDLAYNKVSRTDLSLIKAAAVDLNVLVSNSLGYYQTVLTDPVTGAKTTYLHDQATLEASLVIYVMTESGLAWTDQGWNGGNPIWQYGITGDGNAVFKTLSALGINANFINIEATPTIEGVESKITLDGTNGLAFYKSDGISGWTYRGGLGVINNELVLKTDILSAPANVVNYVKFDVHDLYGNGELYSTLRFYVSDNEASPAPVENFYIAERYWAETDTSQVIMVTKPKNGLGFYGMDFWMMAGGSPESPVGAALLHLASTDAATDTAEAELWAINPGENSTGIHLYGNATDPKMDFYANFDLQMTLDDEKLALVLPITHTANGAMTYHDITQRFYNSATNVGTICINFGKHNVMLDAEIDIQSYTYLGNLHVRGYTYMAGATWHNFKATQIHHTTLAAAARTIRTANAADGSRCVLIGITTTDWQGYLAVSVPKMTLGYGMNLSMIGDVTVSLLSSEAGYTNITAVNPNDGTNADLLDGYHVDVTDAVNTIALRNAAGSIYMATANLSYGTDNFAASHYHYEYNTDGFIRRKTIANVRTEIVTKAAIEAALTGSISTHSHVLASSTVSADQLYTTASSTSGTITAGATVKFTSGSERTFSPNVYCNTGYPVYMVGSDGSNSDYVMRFGLYNAGSSSYSYNVRWRRLQATL